MEVYYQQNKNLWDAARDNVLGQAKNLILQGHDINERSEEGLTPLMYACTFGSTETAQFLIEEGADVNAAHIDDKTTALMLAAVDGYRQIVESLISYGANKKMQDKDGNDASFYAAFCGDCDIYDLVKPENQIIDRTNANGDTRLLIAVKEGHLALAKYLLKQEANLNSTDKEGNTPIMLAARKGFSKLVKLFLKHSSQIGKVNNIGQNPLMKSLMYGHSKTSKLLLKHFASLNIRDIYSNTLLHYAIYGSDRKIIENIMELSQDLLAIENDEGYTPAKLAKWQGKNELLEVLNK